MEQSLRKLGVEKLSKEDVQKMQWEALELKIGSWIQYMRISVGYCDICCTSADVYNQLESAAHSGAD